MCIPHSSVSRSVSTSKREKKTQKKHIDFNKDALEKGDSDFIDERKSPYIPKEKKSFFDGLF
jgi:hypothetical protein